MLTCVNRIPPIINNPFGIVVDSAGNVYVTGNRSFNAFKITPAGVITQIIDFTGAVRRRLRI